MLSPPCPSLLGSVETVPYEFHGKGSSPWWGLWLPGHKPLLSAMYSLSFHELMQWEWEWDAVLLGPCPLTSKQRLQDIPWRLTGRLPPQLRDPAQPHSSGCPALNITQRAPCRQGRNTPSLRLRVYRCFPSGLFFLT